MIIQILVRVPWDTNDNPQVKSLQWLSEKIAAGIEATEEAEHDCRCTYDLNSGIINVLRD